LSTGFACLYKLKSAQLQAACCIAQNGIQATRDSTLKRQEHQARTANENSRQAALAGFTPSLFTAFLPMLAMFLATQQSGLQGRLLFSPPWPLWEGQGELHLPRL
jgi:hypothetical protein